MKNFPEFTSNRRIQILFALSLVMGLLFLLGMWGSLSTVKATNRSPEALGYVGPRAGYEILSGTLTVSIYMPYIRKDPTPTPTNTPTATQPPPVIFFDDFSNPNSGWIIGSGGDCKYEYKDGYYRITITNDGERCVAFNPFIPKTIDGTFSVSVRRTTASDRELRYGFYFGAGANAEEDRWFLEVEPHEVDQCNDEGFFWLSAIEDGDAKFFDDQCTDDIKTNQNDWNELKVVRDGSDIDIYINGEFKEDYDKDYLDDKGYFDLVVVGVNNISDSKPGVVEFDNFRVAP